MPVSIRTLRKVTSSLNSCRTKHGEECQTGNSDTKQFKTSARRIDKGVHQAGFLVLRETSMPGVLVELGYISTPDEEQYLLSDTGSEALANSIYKAFLNYKREHDAPIDRSKVQQPEVPEPEESVAETPTDEPDSAPEPVRSNRKPDTPNIKTNKSNPEVVHKPIFKYKYWHPIGYCPKQQTIKRTFSGKLL